MSAQDVFTYFVRPMKVIFGDPPGDAPEEAIMVYVRPLSRHGREVLERTAQHFQESAKRRTWPMPEAVIGEANRIEAELRNAAKNAALANQPRPLSDAERELLADRAILSEMGLDAAREGWIVSLYEFWIENARKPDGVEIARLKREADDTFRKAKAIIAGEENCGVVTSALVKLGQAMLARRERMKRRVLEWAEQRAESA